MSSPPQHRTEVQKITVAADEAGRRLDNFISSRLKNVPKSRLYQMLRRGEVRVNGSRARQDYRLEDGDIVRLPPLRTEAPAGERNNIPRAACERLLQRIVYEDERLLVLDKPAGLAVHGGSGIRHGVIEMLRAGHGSGERLELVHRLDRETSGCLLLAKDMVMLRQLHDELRAGRVRKGYMALVKGRLQQRELHLDAPLTRQKNRSGERMVVIDATGKASATHIRRRRLFAGATLVDVDLLTGRTHQIRVHAAAAGHPLAGDPKYGDKAFNKEMRTVGLRRLFLHAARIELPQLKLEFQAPLPEELNAVLGRMK